MTSKMIILFIVLNTLLLVSGSKILMVFIHFGRSHYFQGNALGKGLAKAGHDVTMVSPFQDSSLENPTGYKEIVLEGLLGQVGLDTNFVQSKSVSPFIMIPALNLILSNYTETTINHPEFQILLHKNETFDVIILEDLFFLALRGLGCHFKAPLILYNPFGPTTITNAITGNPAPPSYVPNLWMGYSNSMTFLERSMNLLFNIVDNVNLYFFLNPIHQKLLQKYFPSCPNIDSVNRDVSLILFNTHESVNAPVPIVPYMVNILGFHLKDQNSLPQDLQEYLDNSKHGVILFSFGTFVHPSKMDPDIKKSFVSSLGKLKENILWKTDEETILNKPKNIKLIKWLPQQDVLAHPNTKLFITHAGFISTIETIYYGVPVLTVPLAGDQNSNAARILELGLGLKILLDEVTEAKLDVLLEKLLNNKVYSDNIKKRSQLLRDRPIKPMDLATYWIEFVIRHKGAQHLRIAGLDLHWYQYLLLDVVLVWCTVIFIVLFLVVTLLRRLCKKRNPKRKVKVS